MDRRTTALAALVAAALGTCAVLCSLAALRWPLMGDTVYMHYAVRLIHAGMRPYADLVEMNMPGSYLLESGVLSVLGAGSMGWRLFDLFTSSIAILLITRLSPSRLAGVAAASLFYCIHLQDGVMMGGERDYSVAVFLLAALYFLFKEAGVASFACGVCIGAAICIKPTAIVFIAPAGIWLFLQHKKYLLLFASGLTLAPATCAFWLWRHHALFAFKDALMGLVALHASIDNQPLTYLLTHAASPVGFLVCLWIIGALLQPGTSSTQWLMRSFVLCGWLTYALQRKGFSYQRYPFLIFLLLVIAVEVPAWFRQKPALRVIASLMAVLATGSAVFATYRVLSYERTAPETSLMQDIVQFNVSGKTQCLDTAGYCIAAMEHLGRIQATGLIYDCYLTRNDNAVSRKLRDDLLQKLEAAPPQTIVMTNSVCHNEPRSFSKYRQWPTFENWFQQNYALAVERTPTHLEHYWSRKTQPFGWRVYTHR